MHIYIYTHSFSHIIFHHVPPKRLDIVPCAIYSGTSLFILANVIVCIHSPQTPSPSHSLQPPLLATTSLFSMSEYLFTIFKIMIEFRQRKQYNRHQCTYHQGHILQFCHICFKYFFKGNKILQIWLKSYYPGSRSNYTRTMNNADLNYAFCLYTDACQQQILKYYTVWEFPSWRSG